MAILNTSRVTSFPLSSLNALHTSFPFSIMVHTPHCFNSNAFSFPSSLFFPRLFSSFFLPCFPFILFLLSSNFSSFADSFSYFLVLHLPILTNLSESLSPSFLVSFCWSWKSPWAGIQEWTDLFTYRKCIIQLGIKPSASAACTGFSSQARLREHASKLTFPVWKKMFLMYAMIDIVLQNEIKWK